MTAVGIQGGIHGIATCPQQKAIITGKFASYCNWLCICAPERPSFQWDLSFTSVMISLEHRLLTYFWGVTAKVKLCNSNSLHGEALFFFFFLQDGVIRWNTGCLHMLVNGLQLQRTTKCLNGGDDRSNGGDATTPRSHLIRLGLSC